MNNLQQRRFFKRNLQCKNCNAAHKFKHCPKIICNRCHENGHIGRYCKNETYLANLNLKCDYSQNNLLNQRKDKEELNLILIVASAIILFHCSK